MLNFLSRLPEHDLLPLLIVAMLAVAGIIISVGIVASIQWRKYRSQEAAAALVQDMLARGVSTHEVERLLAAAGFDRAASHEND